MELGEGVRDQFRSTNRSIVKENSEEETGVESIADTARRGASDIVALLDHVASWCYLLIDSRLPRRISKPKVLARAIPPFLDGVAGLVVEVGGFDSLPEGKDRSSCAWLSRKLPMRASWLQI